MNIIFAFTIGMYQMQICHCNAVLLKFTKLVKSSINATAEQTALSIK